MLVCCPTCRRHVRAGAVRCPFCGRRSAALRALETAGGCVTTVVLAACYGSSYDGKDMVDTGDTASTQRDTIVSEIDLCAAVPSASVAATVQVAESCLAAGAPSGSIVVGATLVEEASGACADVGTGEAHVVLTLTRDDGLQVETYDIDVEGATEEIAYPAPWISCVSGTACGHTWTAEATLTEGPSAHGTLWVGAELDTCGGAAPPPGALTVSAP